MPSLRSHCTLLNLSVLLFFQKHFPELYVTYAWKCLLLVAVNALLQAQLMLKVTASPSNPMRLKRTKSPSRGHMQ